jgi:hypothetical protein
MMTRKLFFTVLILFSVTLFASAAFSQTVSGSIGRGTVERGDSVEGLVVLTIPSGLHVNSNRPNSQYAIPTTVRITSPGVRIDKVRYPRGQNRKFAFSENVINVYEGRTPIRFTVKVPENFRGNTIRVRAVVRYQACTEEVCYPPRTKEITMTARVT